MAINSRQWLSRKHIILALIITAILIATLMATFSLFSPKAPEQRVPGGQDDFFQRYEQAISELRSGKAHLPSLPDVSSGRLASDVVSLASHYAIEPEVHSSTAEWLALSLPASDPEAIIQWLALLRVNYQLHISSIKVILSNDGITVSIPELVLVKSSF